MATITHLLREGEWVLYVTGHERSLPIKQAGKQTLNLNVNESAVATSEASRLPKTATPGPEFMAPLHPPASCSASSPTEV